MSDKIAALDGTATERSLIRLHRGLNEPYISTLHVGPALALMDEPIKVRVTGLAPFSHITLAAFLNEGGYFGAYAHYTADEYGTVDVSTSSSVGGSYVGTEREGLIWAMEPLPGEKIGLRFLKKDVTVTIPVTVLQLAGHMSWEKVAIAMRNFSVETRIIPVVNYGTMERTYLGPGVTRVEVNAGRLRGFLFIPPGEGRFPGILDMFGIAGGCIQIKSAMLASRGFATLALAYHDYKDLPSVLEECDMSYFEEAVDWMWTHPKVDNRRGLGAVGISKGAEIVLGMAEFLPRVTAVVPINSFYLNSGCPMRYKDITKPPQRFNYDGCYIDSENVVDFGKSLPVQADDVDFIKSARLNVEKSKASFLILAAGFDGATSPISSQILMERLRLRPEGQQELVVYPGAGHLLEPPHAPLCKLCYHKGLKMVINYGGEKRLHSYAQVHAWNKMLNFFHDNLSSDVPKSHL